LILASRRARLILLAALSAARLAAEEVPLSGKVGFRVERLATDTAQFYPYSLFGRLEYTGFETVVPYTQLRHTQNRRIFDGLGNTETIGVSDGMLGAEWEVTEKFLLDGFYRLGLGTNEYSWHEGSLSAVFTHGLADVTLALDYNRTSYIFPGSSVTVLNTVTTPEAEVLFRVHPKVAIPVGVEYSAMTFSSAENYGLFLAGTGVEWKISDRWDWVNRINFGRDSSGYSIWGVNTKPRWKAFDHVRFSVWLDYMRYSKAATTTGTGKKSLGNNAQANAGKTNPLGTSDSFSYFTLGFEASYSF